MAKQPTEIPKYKSQPWILFDTIASPSLLLGDPAGLAIGGQTPAISSNGEITFFQSAGRTSSVTPWYSNLDVPGQLSYGLQVWQIYVNLMFPAMPSLASAGGDPQSTPTASSIAGTLRLAEAILNFGVLKLNLGQEEQAEWPLSRFAAGGGLAVSIGGSGQGVTSVNNGIPTSSNVLKLPEPIEMGRTQNLSAKIKLAPEVFAMIGTPAAPGVGSPLQPYSFYLNATDAEPVVLPMQPYQIQLGFVGRRVKNTQYGQLVRENA